MKQFHPAKSNQHILWIKKEKKTSTKKIIDAVFFPDINYGEQKSVITSKTSRA